MRDGITVYAIDLRQRATFELVVVDGADVAQHRAGELGESEAMLATHEKKALDAPN